MADLNLPHILLLYVVLLASLTVHEASHALLALIGGDRTAYIGGQVTLNPVPHIRREPFGTVILPLIVLFVSKGTMILGYAHTPIDMAWAHRHPRRAALMSAAGPISNFLLAGIAFASLKILIASGVADPYPQNIFMLASPVNANSAIADAVIRMCSVFVSLNLLLGVFNLFPWPPLDGAGVLEGLFSKQLRGFYTMVRSQPFLLIIGIVLIWQILPEVFGPVVNAVVGWI